MGHEELSGAWEKFYWGKAHVERLGVEIDAFLDRNLRAFRAEFDGQGYLVYPSMEAAPSEWPLVLGDGIHSLRGALDHTMWAMVMRTHKGRLLTKRQRKEIQFPLAPSVREVEATPTYKFLDPYSRSIICDLHRNRTWQYHPFRVLNELSNEDKHRLLLGQVAALDAGTFHLLIGQNSSILKTTQPVVLVDTGDRLSNDAPVARFGAILLGPDPQVDVQGYIPGRIEFSPGGGELIVKHDWLPMICQLLELTLQRFDLLLQGHVPEP